MSFRSIGKTIWKNPGNRGQRIRRTLSAVEWQFWKRIVRRPRIMTLVSGRRFIAHPDCVISSALIYSDLPEYHELSFIRRWLRPEDMLLDVGANVGHMGLLMSDIVKPQDILAFEPTPLTFLRLSENWELNNIATDGLKHVAIGSREGTIFVPDVQHPDTMNSPVEAPEDSRTPVVEVAVHTLDSYRSSWHGKRIGLVKIDVEGHEVAVFQGAVATLKHDRPSMLMFESLRGRVEPEIESVLKESDFRVFELDGNGQPDASRSAAQNLFAIPSERWDEVMRG